MPILDIAQDLSNTYLFDNIWKRSLRLCWDHPPLFFLLAALGLACGMWPRVQHGGSSSPTRDWTPGPALGAWSLSRWTRRGFPYPCPELRKTASCLSSLPRWLSLCLEEAFLFLPAASHFGCPPSSECRTSPFVFAKQRILLQASTVTLSRRLSSLNSRLVPISALRLPTGYFRWHIKCIVSAINNDCQLYSLAP